MVYIYDDETQMKIYSEIEPPLKNGANINHKDQCGESALMWAIYDNHVQTIR